MKATQKELHAMLHALVKAVKPCALKYECKAAECRVAREARKLLARK